MEASYSSQRKQKSIISLTQSEEHTGSTQASHPSLLIQKSSNYVGLSATPGRISKFQSFNTDPLYRFPTSSASKDDATVILDRNEFISADLVNLKATLIFLHEKSPFRRGNAKDVVNPLDTSQSSVHGVPKNSINLGSTYSQALMSRASLQSDVEPFNLAEEMAKDQDTFSMESSFRSSVAMSDIPDKPDISINSKNLILQIQRDFQCKQEDELHLHSITPASSLANSDESGELTPISLRSSRPIFDTKSSISSNNQDEFLFNSTNLELSMIEWEEKRKSRNKTINEEEEIASSDEAYITDFKTEASCIAELVPEQEDENSMFLFKSIEALKKAKLARFSVAESEISSPPEDEGSIRISAANRLFLNGQTASKAKMGTVYDSPLQFRQLQPKILTDSMSFAMSTFPESQRTVINAPDMNSPLIRKLVICEENPNTTTEIKNNKEIIPVTIQFSFAACGYNTVPILEFSKSEGKSKGVILYDDNKQLLNSIFPTKILRELSHNPVKLVSCGFEHCAAVTSDGKVLTWGYGSSGCLGHGDTNTYVTPTLINSLFQEIIVYLECGGYHNAAITEDGDVWVWGRNDVHQLGINFSKTPKDEIGHVALRPIKLKSLNEFCIKGIACGEAHTLALDSDGVIHIFGWAEDGQLGISPSELKDGMMTTEIKEIQSIKQKITKVSAGSIFSACLTESGEVYVWGNGEQGQLGLGNNIKRADFPSVVASLKNENAIDLVCGESHVICATQSGKIYGWGQGIVGDFGNDKSFPRGSDIICSVPRLLSGVDIAHRYIMKKKVNTIDDLAAQLTAKLLKLQQS
ncbi:unnamed protein product [Blepharisma stoltei]|uniref:Uncharacterized protein n=1 Tax=Blepharisma stoltei TaxID=1481888 RepID=A0AAU9IEB1_9CILI|nr:unnamed protein product [Blepharisma stoltei]